MTTRTSKGDMIDGFLDWFDQMPKWARMAMMVLGFIMFWPIGLAILGYMIWSGQMGCKHSNGGMGFRGSRFGRRFHTRSSGNMAFDEYRDATLRQLEEDQREFAIFIEQLRRAKDQREFDEFMSQRMSRRSEDKGASSGISDGASFGNREG